MLALDTNVLVRFLVEDDEAQSARAAKLVARAERETAGSVEAFGPLAGLCPVPELVGRQLDPLTAIELGQSGANVRLILSRGADELGIRSRARYHRPNDSTLRGVNTTVDPSQGGLCENPRANVLVRFLVEDDEAQAARAVKLVARAVRQGDQLFVADVVLCETVWVLRAGYEFDRDATQGAALHGAVASPDAKGG